MSNLDSYLSNLFQEHNMNLPYLGNQLPAVYGNGIFPNLNTIVARMNDGDDVNSVRINRRMASVRQSIEHLFALHHNIFALFHDALRFKLLVSGNEVRKIIFNSFFLLNCYICFNESQSHFLVRPASIDEYLPLHEHLSMAPEIADSELGLVYRYFGQN